MDCVQQMAARVLMGSRRQAARRAVTPRLASRAADEHARIGEAALERIFRRRPAAERPETFGLVAVRAEREVALVGASATFSDSYTLISYATRASAPKSRTMWHSATTAAASVMCSVKRIRLQSIAIVLVCHGRRARATA